MSAPSEPRNPFYLLLLIVGLAFIATVLAYAFVPVIEQKAMDAGQMPPESPFRDALRKDGWKWVLGEVALLVVLGLASMGLDRWRRWKMETDGPREATHDTKPEPAPPDTRIQAATDETRIKGE
jgi:hypothetical protein